MNDFLIKFFNLIIRQISSAFNFSVCWAFSAIAVLESWWALRYGRNVVSFSEQHVASCTGPRNCQNGWNPYDGK